MIMQLGIRGGGGVGGQVQKAYTNMFGRLMVTATEQLLGTIRTFVERWEPEELSIPMEGGTVEERKKAFIEMEREATVVYPSSDTTDWYIALQPRWFKEYISAEMGTVCDCVIGVVSNDFAEVQRVGVVVASTSS